MSDRRSVGSGRRRWPLGLLLVGAIAGCATPDPLPIAYAGCGDVPGGCELFPGEALRIWVAAPPEAVEPSEGAEVVAAPGGARVSWRQPKPGRVRVSAGGRVAELALLAPVDRPWESELRQLEPDACLAAAVARAGAATEPAERGAASWAAAGCALRAGTRDRALEHMQIAVDAYTAAGREFDATRARCALSSLLFGSEGTLPRVRGLLEAVHPSDNGVLTWGAAWHRALLHRRTGNYRAAAVELDRAERAAERLGLAAELDTTREQRAVLAGEVGRLDEAVELQRALVATSPVDGDCTIAARGAARRSALAWFLLLDARARGEPPGAEVAPLLDATTAVHARCEAPARDLANDAVNRALAAQLAGDHGRAAEELAVAVAAQPGGDPLYNAWVAEIQGRIALAEGDLPTAEAAFDHALAHARLRGAPEAEAQALDGRATVRWASGDRAGALADREAAGAALRSGVALVPMDAGAAAFLSAREAITARHVEALLALGRPSDALTVARVARSTLLRAGHVRARLETLPPDAQRRWDDAVARYRALRIELDAAAADAWALSVQELEARRAVTAAREQEARRTLDEALAVLGEASAAAPPPPAAGDVLLLWFPAGRGWVGFAATPDGVETASIAEGEDLLAPFAATIRAARRVVLLPWGPLRDRDLHTLDFDGAPLLAGRGVVWSLDLGAPEPRRRRDRLVVADPGGDLPGARAEAEQVRAVWPDARVLTGAEARVDTLRGALGTADVLHYAGHATFRSGDAWEAGLPLADGVLRVGDVLALPRVPAEVVLSACESGRTEAVAVEGWGLAHAFVAGGAEAVVATSRPVADRAAARLAASLHRGDDPLPERLRRAQLDLRAAGEADWSAYRVWVP